MDVWMLGGSRMERCQSLSPPGIQIIPFKSIIDFLQPTVRPVHSRHHVIFTDTIEENLMMDLPDMHSGFCFSLMS